MTAKTIIVGLFWTLVLVTVAVVGIHDMTLVSVQKEVMQDATCREEKIEYGAWVANHVIPSKAWVLSSMRKEQCE